MKPPIGIHAMESGTRLYEHFYQLCVLCGCVAVAGEFFALDKVSERKDTDWVTIECKHFQIDAILPAFGPARAAINNNAVGGIRIALTPTEKIDLQTAFQHVTTGLKTPLELVLRQFFNAYYEHFLDWIHEYVSTDATKWPVEWDFARVVRNACSHGGRVYMPKPTSRSVTFAGVTISHADHGTELFETKLSVGDLIPLVLIMDRTLADVGCDL
ncbi:MAG: hypothetical protein NXH78_05245 [Hyphomonadaceae bacterium]|nr:hypothetical protein [Hyphomonadaceae bacterium]